jgi:hypothetical protein
MHVQFYPPHSPPDPEAALEDNLRRAYLSPDAEMPDTLAPPFADLLRRLRDRARLSDGGEARRPVTRRSA